MSTDDSVSDAIGSEGTATGSCTGSGGAGGRELPVDVAGGGETGGRAPGGFFSPHAPATISATIAITRTVRLCVIVSAFSLLPFPFYLLPSASRRRAAIATSSDTGSFRFE